MTDQDKRKARNPAVGLEPRTCAIGSCGERFQPYRDSQVTCSRRCWRQLPEQQAASRTRNASPDRIASLATARRKPERLAVTRTRNRRNQLAEYGLTPEQFDVMKAEQCGVCKICGQPPRPDGKRAAADLHADHDHTTKQHRDLLCLNCNVGIGMFRDDPALLRVAAEYIERHRAMSALAG